MSERHIVWFGMKLTPRQKRNIERLAQRRGVSQKAALLDLVEEAVQSRMNLSGGIRPLPRGQAGISAWE